jgi:AcrR family transcriptional regulator
MSTTDQQTRKPGRKPRLSREQVLRAALAIADAQGIEQMSMRAIGQELGAEAMSLYRHVENKDDVIDGIVDLVYEEIEVPADADDWRDAMRRRAVSARKALIRHPWASALMESRLRPGPANLRHHDAVAGILLGAGFTTARAVTRGYNLLDSYIYGFALQETSLPFDSAQQLAEVGEVMFAEIPAELYPNLHRVSRELIDSGFSYADEFEVGLDLVLDAVERMPRD